MAEDTPLTAKNENTDDATGASDEAITEERSVALEWSDQSLRIAAWAEGRIASAGL